jgi:hypothetical protein
MRKTKESFEQPLKEINVYNVLLSSMFDVEASFDPSLCIFYISHLDNKNKKENENIA